MKAKLILILLVLCISSSAYAIPVTWTFSGGSTSGGFDYNADTNVATNVLFSSFGNTYTSLNHILTGPLGNDLFGTSTGGGIFSTISLIGLIPGLSNSGGIVDYYASFTNIFGINVDTGNLIGTSIVSVPEPATMALLGLGLLGLGWTRRKAKQ